jgi:hypothetical protein
VREVNPAYSQAVLRQHQQSIGGNARVGAAVAGDVHRDISVTQRGDYLAGDKVSGDKVAGDKITLGGITGSSGVAIGRGAGSTVRNVNTGGGDYAEGTIDKRSGTFVSGDQFNLSRLQKTAENIAKVLPTVLPIAVSIADTVRRLVGM